MDTFETSIIISTYNQPMWLEKVLWGYECQTVTDFEIVIADDGSSKETTTLIENFRKESNLPIVHLWHEDNGFRKTEILNKALLKASSDYIIFTDGDCIPRKDFVATHLKYRRNNVFLSGGYFKLPKTISHAISKNDVLDQTCFCLQWLMDRGLIKNFKTNKLTSKGFKEWLLNNFTTTKATFDGMNVSGWKQPILDVNGFDERMAYGGEDRELGERLINKGFRFRQIRYSAICLHLYHERPYKSEALERSNKLIRKATKKDRAMITPYGIKKNRA